MATISGDFNTNLVGHWKLEESTGDRVDEKGNNDLTPYNTPTSAAGKQGDGISLTRADNEYLAKGSITALPSGSSASTVSVWFKITDIGGGYFVPFEWGTAGTGTRWQCYYDTAANRWYVSDNSAYKYVSDSTADDGNWHHLAVTYAGSANISTTNTLVYLDGASLGAGTIAGSHTPNVGTANFSLCHSGLEAYPTAFAISGIVDEVSIWTAELSAANISTIYNSGNGIAYAAGATPTFTPRVSFIM